MFRLNRPATLAALTAAMIAVTAVPAAAKPPRVYGGLTSDHNPFTLTLDPAGKRLRTIGMFVAGDCNGYMSFGNVARAVAQLPASQSPGEDLFDHDRLRAGGRFDVTARLVSVGDDATITVSQRVVGRVRRNAASGTLKVDFDATDRTTGETRKLCSLPSLRWTAERSPKRIYAGSTSDHLPVVVELNRTRATVRHLRVAWLAPCGEDMLFTTGDDLLDFPVRSGAFGDAFTYDQTVEGAKRTYSYDIRGRVRATTASGSMNAGITDSGPDGDDQCGPREVTWKAISS